MVRFVKIVVAIIALILLAWSSLIAGYSIHDRLQWREAAANPFVEEIGRWNGKSFNASIQIDPKLLPIGTLETDWFEIMNNHDFKGAEADEKCPWGSITKQPELAEYDSCAAKVVGDPGFSGCSYIYVVAANFNSGALTEAIGTHGHFMCM